MKKILFGIAVVVLSAGIFLQCGTEKKEATKTDAKISTLPSLQTALDAKKADFAKMANDEMKQVFAEGLKKVAASGVLETALKKGDKAPDFALPNTIGQNIKLSNLLKNGLVVLTWYRGGWCPYCNIQLNAYNQALSEFKAANGQLVAISPEIPDSSLSTSEKNGLKFEVLSDIHNEVANDFGIVYTLPEEVAKILGGMIDLNAYNKNSTNQLPLAVTYIIDSDMTIQYAFIDADYKNRAEPSELIEVLNSLK